MHGEVFFYLTSPLMGDPFIVNTGMSGPAHNAGRRSPARALCGEHPIALLAKIIYDFSCFNGIYIYTKACDI